MENIQIFESDMDTIKKIVNREIDIHQLPETEVKRLIRLCQYQNDNLDKKIIEKERKIARLENKIEEYKKNCNL